MDWHAVADGLFDRGHDIVAVDDLLSGTGQCDDTVFAVVGSTNHAEIGVELTVAMANRVLATMREHPGRPILFLVDTQGQRLRHRDELLGIHRYMAHLAQCVELARARGHRRAGWEGMSAAPEGKERSSRRRAIDRGRLSLPCRRRRCKEAEG